MVAVPRRRIPLLVLLVVGMVIAVGAVLSARSPNQVQGVVQTRIVNDLGTRVRFAICKDSKCAVPDTFDTLAPGQVYNQAVGPDDLQRFAIEAGSLDNRSSEVSGKAYRCTQLATGSTVAESYDLSTLTPCG